MPAPTIFIADDHPIVLSGLSMLIQSERDLCVIATAANGVDAWNMISDYHPDIAILDITLPSINGLDLTRQMRDSGLKTRVIVLTQHDDRAHLRQALDVGACGYVLKRSAISSIVGAIRGVLVGGLFIDPFMATHFLPTSASRRPKLETAHLTLRESHVLKEVAAGKTAKEIARELDVSVSSVETYKARATEKLSIKSRAEIVSYASVQGWMASL